MHVVFLTHEYPPFTFGGVATFVENLAGALSRMGVRTTVLCGYPFQSKFSYNKIKGDGDQRVDIIRFPYPNLPPRHTLFQVLNLKKLRDTVRDIQCDVIHGQAGSAFPASIVLRNLAPIVVTFHGSPKAQRTIGIHSLTRGGSLGDFSTYVLGYPMWSSTFRMEFRLSKIAVAVSRTLMSDLLKEMAKAYSEKLCAIHNGVDIDRLNSQYEHFGKMAEERNDTVLFAGRLFWGKGVHDLVRIAALLQKKRPNLRLVVHGTGPLFGTINSDIKRLGLRNMKIKGFDVGELMKSMKRSSFVVLPSAYEACPMIILEAMCLGKIPVMFDLPYAREITDNGKYAILATTVEDMVTKIGMAIDTSSIEALQKRIREYSRGRYNAERMAREYLHVYEKACN